MENYRWGSDNGVDTTKGGGTTASTAAEKNPNRKNNLADYCYREGFSLKMKIMIPIEQYDAFLEKCEPKLPQYELLRNAFIINREAGKVVEILCNLEQADELLALAKKTRSVAASVIEESIRLHRDL